MATFLTLPVELICEILEHFLPPPYEQAVSKWPSPYHHYHDESHDIAPYWRHDADSYDTLDALAKTCSALRRLAFKAMRQCYSGSLDRPSAELVRKLQLDPNTAQELKHVTVAGRVSEKYTPTSFRLTQLRTELEGFGVSDTVLEGIDDTPAQAELALLLLKSSNLSTLHVHAKMEELPPPDPAEGDGVPVWLEAIITTMPSTPDSISGHSFSNLQTVEVSLGRCFNLDLARLFYLPSLRRLCLDDLLVEDRYFDNPEEQWPAPASISSIQALCFREMYGLGFGWVKKMIESCKALTVCEIQVTSELPLEEQWRHWHGVLEALQRHSATLTELALREYHEHNRYPQRDEPYQHVNNLHSLHSLKVLEVPWAVLMGKSHAQGHCIPRDNEDSPCQSEQDWEGHPNMRDVLPPNLQTLTCAIEAWREPEGFYNDSLLSALPVTSDETRLKIFNCLFFEWDGTPLPMDFAIIEDAYREVGVEFNYETRGLKHRKGGVTGCCMDEHAHSRRVAPNESV